MYDGVVHHNFHIIGRVSWHWNEVDGLRKLDLVKDHGSKAKSSLSEDLPHTIHSCIGRTGGFSWRRRVEPLCAFQPHFLCGSGGLLLLFFLLKSRLRDRKKESAIEPVLFAVLA